MAKAKVTILQLERYGAPLSSGTSCFQTSLYMNIRATVIGDSCHLPLNAFWVTK